MRSPVRLKLSAPRLLLRSTKTSTAKGIMEPVVVQFVNRFVSGHAFQACRNYLQERSGFSRCSRARSS